MQVEIWSDVVCPWCYIGKRRFEDALSRFEHRDQVEVVWRAFELDPSAPRWRPGPYAERLAAKYRMSVPEAQATIDHMVAVAAGEGLEFHFEAAQPGNTFDAHRLLHLALERGVQDALKERLMAANFTEGAAIGDPDVLVSLAVEAGLDRDEVFRVVKSDAFAAEVRADEQRAAALGISAVPFFVVNEKYGVSGAQPAEMLVRLLEDVWREDQALSSEDPVSVATTPAAGCTEDTCAIAP
jgi:predicted DsbA family dithiol-disulfide isomerase